MRPVSVNSRTARVALSLFFSFMYATHLSGCNKANLDAAPIAEKPGELTKTVAALQGTDGEAGAVSMGKAACGRDRIRQRGRTKGKPSLSDNLLADRPSRGSRKLVATIGRESVGR